MRTTLDIDDDILKAAKAYAEARGTTVGKVLSGWGRKALEPRVRLRDGEIRNGVPVIMGPPGTPKTTPEDIKALEEEEDEEDARRWGGFRPVGKELTDEEYRQLTTKDAPDGPARR